MIVACPHPMSCMHVLIPCLACMSSSHVLLHMHCLIPCLAATVRVSTLFTFWGYLVNHKTLWGGGGGGGEDMYMCNANGLYYIHRMLSIVGEQERAYLVLKLHCEYAQTVEILKTHR